MRPHVLIVEDKESIRELIHAELKEDFQTTLMPNFAATIPTLFKFNDVRAVVTDWDLGEGPNGVDLLEAVRIRWPSALRVLMSGRMQHEISSLHHGYLLYDFFIPKPWPFGALRAVLKQLLGGMTLRPDLIAIEAQDYDPELEVYEPYNDEYHYGYWEGTYAAD